jgi:hypothetical protein
LNPCDIMQQLIVERVFFFSETDSYLIKSWRIIRVDKNKRDRKESSEGEAENADMMVVMIQARISGQWRRKNPSLIERSGITSNRIHI